MTIRSGESTEETTSFPANLGFLVNELRFRCGVSSVVTSSVCLPYIDENIGKWLACFYIDDADVKEQEEAGLVLGDVLAYGVTGKVIVRTFCYDGGYRIQRSGDSEVRNGFDLLSTQELFSILASSVTGVQLMSSCPSSPGRAFSSSIASLYEVNRSW